MIRVVIYGSILLPLLLSSCEETESHNTADYPVIDRFAKLPDDIEKQGPETDMYPPILHSDEFQEPEPLPAGINTSGGEDSPFILPDGNTFYFFFTPDVRVPVEEQVLDSVTGVWVSRKVDGQWGKAERVWLQDPGKLALDGGVSIQEDEMWFVSAREGYTGVNVFTAEYGDDRWTNWKYAGDRLMKEIRIGEVHIHGNDLYFHSDRDGGFGSFDIWVTTREGDNWSDPVNIQPVNTPDMDGWPFISMDGNELWFTRTYLGTPALYRSTRNGDTWDPPELIVSQFAGEPTLDDAGNLYFTHHFFEYGVMIEADIYVARLKE